MDGTIKKKNPSDHLIESLRNQNIDLEDTNFELVDEETPTDNGISIDDVMNGNDNVKPQEEPKQEETVVTNPAIPTPIVPNNSLNDNTNQPSTIQVPNKQPDVQVNVNNPSILTNQIESTNVRNEQPRFFNFNIDK